MRIVSLIVLVVFSTMTVACAGKQAIVLSHAEPVQTVQVEENKKYLVRFTTGQTYKVKGLDMVMRGDLVGIRFEEKGDLNFYSREQIEEIAEWGGGMSPVAIGAIAGGATGAGLGIIGSAVGS